MNLGGPGAGAAAAGGGAGISRTHAARRSSVAKQGQGKANANGSARRKSFSRKGSTVEILANAKAKRGADERRHVLQKVDGAGPGFGNNDFRSRSGDGFGASSTTTNKKSLSFFDGGFLESKTDLERALGLDKDTAGKTKSKMQSGSGAEEEEQSGRAPETE